jgi:hypothetical protein
MLCTFSHIQLPDYSGSNSGLTCYRIMHRGGRLTPSPTNKRHKHSIAKLIVLAVKLTFQKLAPKILSALAELTRYAAAKLCTLVRNLLTN